MREGRMDTDEAPAEIFPDRDSDVSNLSHSEFDPSDSEESEQKDEQKKLNLKMQVVKEFAGELYETTVQSENAEKGEEFISNA